MEVYCGGLVAIDRDGNEYFVGTQCTHEFASDLALMWLDCVLVFYFGFKRWGAAPVSGCSTKQRILAEGYGINMRDVPTYGMEV